MKSEGWSINVFVLLQWQRLKHNQWVVFLSVPNRPLTIWGIFWFPPIHRERQAADSAERSQRRNERNTLTLHPNTSESLSIESYIMFMGTYHGLELIPMYTSVSIIQSVWIWGIWSIWRYTDIIHEYILLLILLILFMKGVCIWHVLLTSYETTHRMH